jgi:hypothetical protein
MDLQSRYTTSRVGRAGISFPTDLEKYMAARPFLLAVCGKRQGHSHEQEK